MIVQTNIDTSQPRTGFTKVDNAANRKVRQSLSLPRVKDPTTKFQTGSGVRALKTGYACPYKLQDIQNGYMADSYLHRGVNEFSIKIWKEGYYLQSKNKEAIDYLNLRLDLITIATEECWQFTIARAVHDLVKFANAFLIKRRWTTTDPVPGLSIKGVRGKRPIGGYFTVSPLMMAPNLDAAGNVVAWVHKDTLGTLTTFTLDEVIHLTHNKDSGGVWGVAQWLPVLDDIRALRQSEEMIIQLIYKGLNPLMHHEVPDSTQTGLGRQSDVDAAAQAHNVSAVNGYIITPPGHKIEILGQESKALRAEGYLKLLKQRVFAGLGLSELVMGESSTSSAGASESFSTVMHDQIRFYQEEISFYISYYIIMELLLEGGFDPLSNPIDSVLWRFNDVDCNKRVKLEEHAMMQYLDNIITEDEVRDKLRMAPVDEANRKSMYLNTVQIPLAMAAPPITGVASGQKGPKSPAAGGSSTANKVKPKNQHNSTKQALILSSYNQLAESISGIVIQYKNNNTELTKEDIVSICNAHIKKLETLIGYVPNNVVNIFMSTTEQAINEGLVASSTVSAAASVHGRFAVLRHQLLLQSDTLE